MRLGMEIRWEGKGKDEKGFDQHGQCIIEIDPRYYRPAEVETLLGDPSKAKNKLGWEPQITFEELVKDMVDSDLKLAKKAKAEAL
jgi:GDPmannose 4,6-dehydratase